MSWSCSATPPRTPRAVALLERLGAGDLRVALVGEAKRGKSTLANALLGEEVLPAGVVPVTAISTEVRAGSPRRVEVTFTDGSVHTTEVCRVARYVSERQNGHNHRHVRVDRAAVFKKRVHAAELRREPHGVVLVYDDAYLTAGGPAIASTLPVRPEPFVTPAGALPPYLSGLLPEGRRLNALRTAVKTSADDELSLLLAVGADAVGDVQVVPAGVDPEEVPPRVTARTWNEVSFTEVFAAETGAEPDRVARPGVQPKASARMISFSVRRGSGRFIQVPRRHRPRRPDGAGIGVAAS